MAKKLLLADDSVTIQKVVGISFANEDLELLTVDNGDDAVLRAREAEPDVILADVVMPGKNGYEVCEAVKRDPALAHIPVLLLTGTFEAFDEERAASAGADGHITKPFEAQALVDKVNELLARAAAAPAAAPAPAAAAAAAETPAPPPVAAPAEPVSSMPPAAPPDATDDDGFDFFDDELDGDSGPVSENATTAFELDAGESAFDFAPMVEHPSAAADSPTERPTVTTPPPTPEPAAVPHSPPDATIALGVPPIGVDAQVGPDADTGWSDADLDAAFGESSPGIDVTSGDRDPSARTTVFHLDPPAPEAEDVSVTPADVAAPVAEHADEFSFSAPPGDDDFLGDFDAPDVPREAISNPEIGRDFAVSSSDLGDPLGDELDSGLGAELESAPAPVPEPAVEEPVFEPGEPAFPGIAPFSPHADEPTVSPDETSFAHDAGPIFDATPEPDEPPFHTSPETTEVPVERAEEPAFPTAPESSEPIFTPLAEAAAEDFAPPPPEPAAGRSEGNGPDLTPMMRQRVHEAMEKIAWEAFADLPDQIVRQALTRIEAIAWEVIPQMAESLIREEIRRMKGEPE